MSNGVGIITHKGTDLELTLEQRIHYSNKNLVPLQEIAESLLGLEGIIRKSPAVLNRIFPETSIRAVDVYLSEIKSGSLYEDVIVKFVFGSQEKLDETIEKARQKMGVARLMDNNNGLSVLILCMMMTGGLFYIGATSKAPQTQIEANTTNIINISAEALKTDPKELRRIIESVVMEDRKEIANNAVKFIKPAKRDPEATITFNENDQLRILASAIKEMPTVVKSLPSKKTIREYEDVEIEIRATDLDSYKRGWAAKIPTIGKKRIKLHLDIDVDVGYVMTHPELRGDIAVQFEENKDGKKVPKIAQLRKITMPNS